MSHIEKFLFYRPRCPEGRPFSSPTVGALTQHSPQPHLWTDVSFPQARPHRFTSLSQATQGGTSPVRLSFLHVYPFDLLNCIPFPFKSFSFGYKSVPPVQFSSVTQSSPTFCNPKNCSTPGLPVYHQLPEFTQTHVHQVGDAIQPSVVPFSSCPHPSQHQGLFQWVNSLHEVAQVLEFQL